MGNGCTLLDDVTEIEAMRKLTTYVPDDDEHDICPQCAGSGEGMYDGTRCRSCGGSGVERTERDEPDWDAMRKERAELAYMSGDE